MPKNYLLRLVAVILTSLMLSTAIAQPGVTKKKPSTPPKKVSVPHPRKFVGGLVRTKHRAVAFEDQDTVTDEQLKQFLPKVSLESFCPAALYQDTLPWTVAFAAAYLRSIVENKRKDEKSTIAKASFSPTFIYQRCKLSDDADCSAGISIEAALNTLKLEGVPLLKSLNQLVCLQAIREPLQKEAFQYRIASNTMLFGPEYSEEQKVRLLKKALAGGDPVLIDFQPPASFSAVVSDDWEPNPNEVAGAPIALCVMGYDDTKKAFRVINSWGSDWGKDGKCWISYSAMRKFVYEAYTVTPLTEDTRNSSLQAQIALRSVDGVTVPMQLNKGNAFTYQPAEPHPVKKQGRLTINVSSACFMYLFTISLHDNPQAQHLSAENDDDQLSPTKAKLIPSGEAVISLPDTLSDRYILLVFTGQPMKNVDQFTDSLNKPGDNIEQRVRQALAAVSSNFTGSDYTSDTMSFQLLTTTNLSAMIPVLVRL